ASTHSPSSGRPVCAVRNDSRPETARDRKPVNKRRVRTRPPTIITMIRPATVHDVPRIAEIINSHAELGKMLFKSFAQLYEDLRDFAVYEHTHADGSSEVMGCTAVTIIWADLAEVRSLAVDEQMRGRGVGTQLVQWAINEA